MVSVVTFPLAVELVPATSWYRNVRSQVSLGTWDALQRVTFAAAGNRCEICSGVGPTHPVECHEVWNYDDRMRLQTLTRLIALCPRCHRVKHLGFTLARARPDRVEEALAWLCHVNGVSPDIGLSHVRSVFAQYQARSQHTYQLDVGFLRRVGVDLDSRGIERGHVPTGVEY
jgi:hypothetical protein